MDIITFIVDGNFFWKFSSFELQKMSKVFMLIHAVKSWSRLDSTSWLFNFLNLSFCFNFYCFILKLFVYFSV